MEKLVVHPVKIFIRHARLGTFAGMTALGMTALHSTAFAMAQRPNPNPDAPPPPGWVQLVPFVVMFAVFYFLLIRPQLRQKKEKESMVNTLKKGDRVVTQGGLIVTIMNIGPTTMDVKLNDETKVKILKSAVIELYNDPSDVKEPAIVS